MKCPYCNSDSMREFAPTEGCTFVLSEMNIQTHKRVQGRSVHVYGCPDCGGIFLKSQFDLVEED